MSQLNLAIIYYSATGTNYEMARAAELAAQQEGVNVRFRRIRELAPESAIATNPAWQAHYLATQDVPHVSLDDLEWADALVFSVPTRFGNVPSQVQQFIDTTGGLWFQGKLANKVVTAMTSASNAHGGQEATLLSLYTTMYHWGAIVVAPGYTSPEIFQAGGNPYGASATVNRTNPGVSEDVLNAVRHQVRRVIEVARWIHQGKQA